jgi:hypothetical protein
MAMDEEISNTTPDDDVFAQFVQQQKEAEKEKSQKHGNFTSNYDTIKYVGLDKDTPAIVRFVGRPPVEGGHRYDASDAKELHISKIKGDDGKVMWLYLPLKCDNPDQDHLMWRIIGDVMHKEYISNKGPDGKTTKKAVFVNEIDHPDIFALIQKGGYTEEKDGHWPYTYAAGWNAKRCLLINCVDRRDSWCKDNKHTKLLSKSVNVGTDKDGNPREYAEIGVPSYGFLNGLTDLVGKFGSWENYDVVISRTGEKTSPNKFHNGSKYITPAAIEAGLDVELGLSKDDEKLIAATGPLTAEELSYARYDLDKNFQPTSYHTIVKRLGTSIKKIDAALGKHYYDELQALVDEEQKKWDAEKEEKAAEEAAAPAADAVAPVQESAPASAPVTRRVVAAATPTTKLTPEKIAALKGWEELTADERALIEDVTLNADGTVKDITWSADAPGCLPCPTEDEGCGIASPSSFTVCPACGKHFSTAS